MGHRTAVNVGLGLRRVGIVWRSGALDQWELLGALGELCCGLSRVPGGPREDVRALEAFCPGPGGGAE